VLQEVAEMLTKLNVVRTAKTEMDVLSRKGHLGIFKLPIFLNMK
jgi:hypothetical protein